MKKKSASLLLTFVLVFSLFPSALAAQRATPTPPDWVPAEEYAVFEDSDAYEPDNWETILGLRREVSWGAIHVASIPKELDKGYSRLYKLATDRQHPDVGALFEMALIETRLYRLEEGEPAPYWTYLMYHFDRIQESLTQEQRYPVLLWNARSVLHYYGLGEEFYESVTPLLNDPRFSYEKLMDSVIFSEEEKAAFWAAHAEELARFQSRVDLYLDGQPLALDVPPEVRDGRTMVPIRAVPEALGADVSWDQESRRIGMTRAGVTVTMTLDSTAATVDGQQMEMDVAPYATDGRTLIPARYAAEFFGQAVTWDGTTHRADILENRTVAGDSNLEAWAIAMGAIRGSLDEQDPTRFGQTPRTAEARESFRKNLASAWGVGGREELVELIGRMTEHGHNDSFQEAAAIALSLSETDLGALIAISGETDQYMWPYTKYLAEKWGDKGILAWDLSRISNLAQWGYMAGYLTYEEALEQVRPAAELACATFSSWEEFYENYLEGYAWWARIDVAAYLQGQAILQQQSGFITPGWDGGKDAELAKLPRGFYYLKLKATPAWAAALDNTLFETGVVGLPAQGGEK